ncbi:ligase-associated DNA damage response DEXH box helicase [Acidovorax sp. PRC11]|uniref:ligase-associated DNA damage response DEXH box helicase n=1 Tax=Acidovorax sp. PRC11 TaxID=2962592 RepID=UPI002880E3D1|nr:ligase-associated DNA damage response DEXH box helicase [Acidovorax sp. PRC11]MDT0139282.1 ligase-associated DNA damage response DEXH box helicase [Acidovorax sp. PRC11]
MEPRDADTPRRRPRRGAAQQAVIAWLAQRGWKPFAFQREVWDAMARGASGLLHATTGAGKTYAVWLGALQAFAQEPGAKRSASRADPAESPRGRAGKPVSEPLTVLWLTPMRALAADTLKALRTPLDELAATHPVLARWTGGARTGDTGSAERGAQSRRLPTVLVTTPESLSLLLARADARELLSTVRLVVADEWHELLGNKRGVQVQLALARLSGWNPALQVWGMSATLGNLPEAQDALLAPLGAQARSAGVLVQGQVDKKLVVDTLLPDHPERFSWAGHLGLRMLPAVVRELESTSTTLVFVNVRSQAELWYKAILDARPDWAGELAIHHGSLDRGVREWVEAGLKEGRLRAVVCTSSLDLGVDFLPVERVLQIGSAKGIARLLQRAGRSGHAPGRPSRITLVPTHSLELVEAAAARAAVQAGEVEMRASPRRPVDVLVQHLVTVALGGGFEPEALYAEVCRTVAYRDLPRAVWQWCLDFVHRGGPSLAAYPDYQRVAPDEEGIWRMPSARLARRHRSNIGTIVSDASMAVQVLHGARLGTMEESFLSRLSPGDCFVFAGQVLEMVKIEDMTAYVRRAARGRPTVPRWAGSRMPLSTVLADFVVQQLALAAAGRYGSPELRCVRPLLDVQQRWSALPTPGTLLAETLRTREGWHLFVYPFAGRHAHTGLASLFAWRAAQGEAGTFSIAVNDYGLELLSATERDWAALLPELLRVRAVAVPPEPDAPAGEGPDSARGAEAADAAERPDGRIAAREALAIRNTANAVRAEAEDAAGNGAEVDAHAHAGPEGDALAGPDAGADAERHALLHEVLASLNATEMARRRFREIARVSGLIFQSHPGERRSARQLQASSQLFFEVFRKYDTGNMLLRQADEEVLSQELDVAQLLAALRRMQAQELVVKPLTRPSPFAFPLMIERFREKLTNEDLADRIARMLAQLDTAADAGSAAPPESVAAQEVVPPDPPARPQRRRGAAKKAADADAGAQKAEAPVPPAQTAMQQAADAVRRTLDFSLTSTEDSGSGGGAPGAARARRRERKPSRPLPRL